MCVNHDSRTSAATLASSRIPPLRRLRAKRSCSSLGWAGFEADLPWNEQQVRAAIVKHQRCFVSLKTAPDHEQFSRLPAEMLY